MHIFDPSFRECLLYLAHTYDVPLEYVPLELTESGFLEDADTIYDHMKYLKQHGFLLSMDDFGTGYSTITMLKDQPVDEIKLDRSFITDLDNPKTRSVLSHTLDMLHDLNFQIIAEGVEDVSQQDFLLSYDCSFLILLLCVHKLVYCQNNILNFIFHRSDSATKLFHFPPQRPHFCHLVFHGSTQLLTSCD